MRAGTGERSAGPGERAAAVRAEVAATSSPLTITPGMRRALRRPSLLALLVARIVRPRR